MTAVDIRTATTADIPRLAELWQEKTNLLQQADSRSKVLHENVVAWSETATQLLQDERCAIYVAQSEMRLLGYITGCIQITPSPFGTKMGIISDMALDAHSYHGGVGRLLLKGLRAWFAERDIQQIVVYVPPFYAVEQAFWRALGATQVMDVMWLKS